MTNFILSAIATICLLLSLFYFFQRNLIYFPEYTDITPQEAGVGDMRVVTLHTQDGLDINAWYCPPKDPFLPTLVYFHGNAGHIGYRAPLIKPYLQAGFGVFLLTYRGYSGNPGKPSEEGLYNDARASLDYLKGQKVVLFGESIGAAVAIQMALEYPVEGIILQSPFTSLADVGLYHYPYLPVRWLLKDRYNSLEKTGNIHVPVCIIHGQNDGIVPPEMAEKLFKAFSEPKVIYIVPFTGHNDLYEPSIVLRFLSKE